MQLTPTFRSLLLRFRPVFTAPTFATFLTIATGWCLSHRHRYVTELIQSAGAVHRGHHSRYHRFFSQRRLVDRRPLRGAGTRGGRDLLPRGDDRAGRRRHPLPQARADHLRHRHAPRPADLQPQAAPRQLGTRLGDPLAADAQPALVADEGLGPAGGRAAVQQPPGADQGQEGPGQGQEPAEEAAARSRTTAPAPNWPWS